MIPAIVVSKIKVAERLSVREIAFLRESLGGLPLSMQAAADHALLASHFAGEQ